MFVYDDDDTAGLVDQVIKQMERLASVQAMPKSIPRKIRAMMESSQVAVHIVTSAPELEPFFKMQGAELAHGVMLRVRNRYYVLIRSYDPDTHGIPLVVMAHELTHLVGGSELDSEVVERLFGSSDVDETELQSMYDGNLTGQFFHLRLNTNDGFITYQGYPLWPIGTASVVAQTHLKPLFKLDRR